MKTRFSEGVIEFSKENIYLPLYVNANTVKTYYSKLFGTRVLVFANGKQTIVQVECETPFFHKAIKKEIKKLFKCSKEINSLLESGVVEVNNEATTYSRMTLDECDDTVTVEKGGVFIPTSFTRSDEVSFVLGENEFVSLDSLRLYEEFIILQNS